MPGVNIGDIGKKMGRDGIGMCITTSFSFSMLQITDQYVYLDNGYIQASSIVVITSYSGSVAEACTDIPHSSPTSACQELTCL